MTSIKLISKEGEYKVDLDDLKIFKIIAQENSFTHAAKRLNYVQSNVTARIKRLESELNTELFYRHSRGVTVTPTGKTLLQFTDRLFSLVEETKKALSNDGIPRGPLSIGSIESTAAVWLPPLLTTFMKQFSMVDLSLKGGTTEELINEVLEYQLDGAFVAGPVDHPELLQHLFIEEELVLITDKEHSYLKSFQDISQRTLLTLQHGCIYRQQVETWLDAEGIYPKKRMRFSTLEGLFGCVRAGLGIALLSKSYVDHLPLANELHFYSLPDQYSKVSTVFIHRKDVLLTQAFKEFVKAVGIKLNYET
ncbi:LysR family transcriptional regulator [Pseudalkalibacillus decolorationis]|uniref:LysR family transcriptional regulator n=1 Tax=Pseudalkalibacillus decolorationis TaxID=163879 RepID=UPI002147D738|nr:LysR family transcriptional regulator [Pseudalkalibacillus decolorationis]